MSLPLLAQARVVISEVMYDPAHADDRHEWIELYNDGPDMVDLARWTFSEGSSGTKHALNAPPKNGGVGDISIVPGAYAIVADDAATFCSEYPSAVHVIDSTMNLPNPAAGGSTAIILYDSAKQVADTFVYIGGTVQKNTGDSAQRSGNNIFGAVPTPGAANAASPRRPADVVAPETTAKPVTKKTATAAKVPSRTVDDGSDGSASAEQVVPAEDAPASVSDTRSEAQIASPARAVPISASWLWGSGLITLGGAAAAVLARGLKKEEWDIEDASDTV